MLHLHLAAQLHHLARATDAHATGFGDQQAELGGCGVHGFPRCHANALAGRDKFHLMQVRQVDLRRIRGLLGLLHRIGTGFRWRRAKGFFVITGHVETGDFQQTLHCVHVRRRAAAEHFALQEVRHHQLEHLVVQIAAIPGPGFAQAVFFADQVQAEVVDPRRHVLQLAVIDDVLGRAGAVDKGHVDVGVGVVEPARHGHHRRNPHTAAEVQHFRAREINGIEQPDRAVHRQLLAFVQGIVQPIGNPAARHTLDGHRKAVRHRR